MGLITGGGSKTIDVGEEYKYSDGKKHLFYIPGKHPGSYLLPPSAIMDKPTCPQAVKEQIFDGETYDIHGKFAIAFEDGLIDSPVGYAKKKYEDWLKNDAQVA